MEDFANVMLRCFFIYHDFCVSCVYKKWLLTITCPSREDLRASIRSTKNINDTVKSDELSGQFISQLCESNRHRTVNSIF